MSSSAAAHMRKIPARNGETAAVIRVSAAATATAPIGWFFVLFSSVSMRNCELAQTEILHNRLLVQHLTLINFCWLASNDRIGTSRNQELSPELGKWLKNKEMNSSVEISPFRSKCFRLEIQYGLSRCRCCLAEPCIVRENNEGQSERARSQTYADRVVVEIYSTVTLDERFPANKWIDGNCCR